MCVAKLVDNLSYYKQSVTGYDRLNDSDLRKCEYMYCKGHGVKVLPGQPPRSLFRCFHDDCFISSLLTSFSK